MQLQVSESVVIRTCVDCVYKTTWLPNQSKMFRVETIDADRKKRYVQEFTDNLETINPPKITASSSKPFTRITFLPDYERFGLAGTTDDMYAVLEARVYDMAACTPADLAASLNNITLKIKTFEKYMDLYLGSKDECPRVFEKVNERWEVGVGLTDGHFQQISFVNGVNTYKDSKTSIGICFDLCALTLIFLQT